MAPTRSRQAIPKSLMFATSAILHRRGFRLYSLYSRALFSSYLRPSALLLVMTLDLLEAPPAISEMAPFPAIIVAPEDRDERTKTGTFDQTVLLDDKRDSGLGRELVELRDERRATACLTADADGGELPLFDVRPAQFLEEWREAVCFLKCESICHTPYQNRHGGPSRDIQLRLRGLLEVQRRGHLQSATSLRNYEKAARLHRIINKVPMWVHELGEEFRKKCCGDAPTSSGAIAL